LPTSSPFRIGHPRLPPATGRAAGVGRRAEEVDASPRSAGGKAAGLPSSRTAPSPNVKIPVGSERMISHAEFTTQRHDSCPHTCGVRA
jgi:hypothetical protein